MQNAPAHPDLAYRFGLVVMGLCQVVADHVNKDCSNEPFIARIYFSLRRRLTRFERLFARVQAELRAAARTPAGATSEDAQGARPDPEVVEPLVLERGGSLPNGIGSDVVGATVAGAAVAPPVLDGSHAEASRGEKTMRKPYDRLPRRRGWLTRMMPYKAALYWYRLDDLLRDPEMVAFLATSRQARRLVRPLWYGLCGDPLPACLREPARMAAMAATALPAAVATPSADDASASGRMRDAAGQAESARELWPQSPPGLSRSNSAA